MKCMHGCKLYKGIQRQMNISSGNFTKIHMAIEMEQKLIKRKT